MTVANSRLLAGVAARWSRRLVVVGAHSADFVWLAGGAIVAATRAGGTATVMALSYGERGESGELWRDQRCVESCRDAMRGEAMRR